MQRVSALLWERSKPSDASGSTAHRTSKPPPAAKSSRPINKVFSWGDRTAAHKALSVSATAANASYVASAGQMGREAYWPTALDRECEKAARILKSFCTDGFFDEPSESTPTSPTSRTSIVSLTSHRLSSRRSADILASSAAATTTTVPASLKKKIPPRIVQEAVGLAIFSCMRSGLWMSGSGGSGILIARKADGTWSPPSGILLHTATLAFVMGVDIYDCVLVINSVAALEMFTRPRLTLGSDVPLTVGPLVPIGLLENDFRWSNELGNTVLTYVKARGTYRPAQLDGSLVTERANENERFYSDDSAGAGTQPIDILDILAGNIRKSVPEILPLFEAIKAAEGRIDFDSATMDQLSQQPAPGDADIADTPGLLTPTSPKSATFGVPDASDPDPFGIIALEMAGLEIREAGSKHRPSSNQFDYNNASPTSPIFASHFDRKNSDAVAEHGNRASYMSTRTQATSMTDACTQTDVAETPNTSLSPSHSDDGKDTQIAASRDLASPELVPAVPAAPSEPEHAAVETAVLDNESHMSTRNIPEIPNSADIAANTNADANANANTNITTTTTTTTTTAVISDAHDVAIPTRSTRRNLLTADSAAASGDMSDGGDESSYYMDDERDEDADDEDEETDDLSEDGDVTTADDDDDVDDGDDVDDIDDDEEPVIFEVATTATAAQAVRAVPTQVAQVIQAKGALVTIPKRIPPPLPVRSPARTSRASKSEFGDVSMIKSPLRQSFQSAHTAMSASDVPSEAPKAVEAVEAVEAVQAVQAVQIVVNGPSSTRTDEVADSASSPPQATEPTVSSADESDREPQTPRLEDGLASTQHHTVAENDDDDDSRTPKAETQQKLTMETDHMSTSSITVA